MKQILIGIFTAIVAGALIIWLGTFMGSNEQGKGALSRDDIKYVQVDAPAATSQDGTVSAKDWESAYPHITASMWANSKNNYVVSYLEQDPYLVNIYEGYGFAKDYGSARGHEFTLEDVAATARPHPMANCLT
ncbi:MAG: ammonia-forming cytochrome c nitrite reductase subunit c552, partial [Lachnospiraceae bacterium]|nr:ammonia-forming cytochrome c nitrite reductase subunit c552 [Lachnospiraceae bacterium]